MIEEVEKNWEFEEIGTEMWRGTFDYSGSPDVKVVSTLPTVCSLTICVSLSLVVSSVG